MLKRLYLTKDDSGYVRVHEVITSPTYWAIYAAIMFALLYILKTSLWQFIIQYI